MPVTAQSLCAEMPIGPGALDQIHDVLDQLWTIHPEVPGTVRMQVELAAVEIGGNIVEHCVNSGPVLMRMQAAVSRRQVCVNFDDDGGPARVDINSVSMPAELAEQGRGLAIALAVLDELHYQRGKGKNHWTLIRQLEA